MTVTDEFTQTGEEPVKLFWYLNSDRMKPEGFRVQTIGGEILIPDKITTSRSLYYLQKQDRPTLVYTTQSRRVTTTIHY